MPPDQDRPLPDQDRGLPTGTGTTLERTDVEGTWKRIESGLEIRGEETIETLAASLSEMGTLETGGHGMKKRLAQMNGGQ